MEEKGLLPYSQKPANGLYPQPGESNPHPHVVFLQELSQVSAPCKAMYEL
jgi:hypothetical protein